MHASTIEVQPWIRVNTNEFVMSSQFRSLERVTGAGTGVGVISYRVPYTSIDTHAQQSTQFERSAGYEEAG